MRAAAMAILLAIGASAHAQRLPQDAMNVMNVYINEDVSDGGLNLGWARSITSHILAESGFRINWRFRQPRRGEPCMPIVIDLRSNTPETVAPGALAFAQVYEGVHIRVFWDRVKKTVSGADPLGTFLLVHVMAHEIAHILEGIDRHSETGLMKASWTQKEIEGMSVRQLSLSPEDVHLIRDGPVKRVAEWLPIIAKPDPPNR